MAESKFDFVQTVEDTVVGVITFVDDFARTVFYMGVLPHRFPGKWLDESSRESFIKPFTLTAISVFVLYLSVANGMRIEMSKVYPESASKLPSDIRNYDTVTSLFACSIPIIVILFWITRGVSRLVTVGENSRVEFACLALYGASFQCLVFAVSIFVTQLGTKAATWPLILYSSIVCTTIVWKATAMEHGWKRVKKAGVAVGYSLLSVSLIVVLIFLGFVFEVGSSPAGPSLLREAEQKEAENRVKESVKESLKKLVESGDVDDEAKKLYQKMLDSIDSDS